MLAAAAATTTTTTTTTTSATSTILQPLSGTTRVSRYQKKHSYTQTYLDHQPSFISFLHLLQSIASSLFTLRAWQSLCTTSLQILFGLPLGLEPSTSYSIHVFTQSLSSFCNTCPYHRNLCCCSIEIMLSVSSPHNVLHFSKKPLTKVRFDLLQHVSWPCPINHVDCKTMLAKSTSPPNTVQICIIVWLERCIHWKVKVYDHCNLLNVNS